MPQATDLTATIVPALCYRDPMAMFHWLEAAFGFEPSLLITNVDGTLGHSQMAHGNGMIIGGSEWSADHKSPATLDGKNTQTDHVHLDEDLAAHCERARAAGATIIAEPEVQFYGARTYRARDAEGHIWIISQAEQDILPEDWNMHGGMTQKTWPST